MVGKTDKNNAARHGFDMSFIPVSNGRFLRVAVRVNHPGVAVIRTAQQTLLVEVARHVAAGSKGLVTRAADQPHHGHRRRLRRKPERIVPFQGRVAVFRDTHVIRVKIDVLSARHLQRLQLLTDAVNGRRVVAVFLFRESR